MLERHPILQRSVMQDFLQFADVNCQPNGRSQGSSGPTAYFLPKFDTVQTPKVGSRNYEERAKRSVVGEFNRAQDLGRGTCSNGSSHNWLKQYIQSRHMSSPGGLFDGHVPQIKRQSEQSKPPWITWDKVLLLTLEHHCTEAAESHKYYDSVTKKCADEWKAITTGVSIIKCDWRSKKTTIGKEAHFHSCTERWLSDAETCPILGSVTSAGEYLLPPEVKSRYIGNSQPFDRSFTCIPVRWKDGAKNTDHTVSYLSHYITTLPAWVHHINMFLGNACSTNKNWYRMAWAREMVQQKLDYIRVSFMIAGHTKIAPTCFSQRLQRPTPSLTCS